MLSSFFSLLFLHHRTFLKQFLKKGNGENPNFLKNNCKIIKHKKTFFFYLSFQVYSLIRLLKKWLEFFHIFHFGCLYLIFILHSPFFFVLSFPFNHFHYSSVAFYFLIVLFSSIILFLLPTNFSFFLSSYFSLFLFSSFLFLCIL